MIYCFDEAKATQVAAMILNLRGGRMHYIKLIKLMYLVDRAALLRWGHLVTTDRHVSMDNGPVGSNLLRLITEEKREKPVWSHYVTPPMGEFEIQLKGREVPNDRLSPAEEKLIKEVYAEYGYRNRWDLIAYVMHDLPEWQNPHGSSIPISIRDILKAGNVEPEEISAVLQELRIEAHASKVLSGNS
jgi:hypothetical protein